MKTINTLLYFSIAIIVSCGQKNKETSLDKNDKVDSTGKISQSAPAIKEVVTDSTESKIIDFLKNTYIKEDIKFLQDIDRKFQYENIDLNGDGTLETFVRFSSPYFCGSGGCTFLLLDDKQNIITRFTVMDAPIFVERKKKNGWSILLVKNNGVFKEITFNGKKYPSNPSLLKKAPYDAPSSNAFVLFDKEFADSKVSEF